MNKNHGAPLAAQKLTAQPHLDLCDGVVWVGVPSNGSRFWGKHELKEDMVLGSGFLASALVF